MKKAISHTFFFTLIILITRITRIKKDSTGRKISVIRLIRVIKKKLKPLIFYSYGKKFNQPATQGNCR